MYDIVLFDLDGTLTNPKIGITKSVQYALKHFGIDEDDLDKLTCFIGPPLQYSFMEYYELNEQQAKEAIGKYRERFSEVGLFENEVFEGIKELLENLQQRGITLAIATSKPQVFAEQILEHFNLKVYFDIIVGSELDGRRSDKAEVIQEVLRQLDVKEDKEHILMIGDRKHDIHGAKACEIKSIGVNFGFAEEGELATARADYIVETVEELDTLLKQIGR